MGARGVRGRASVGRHRLRRRPPACLGAHRGDLIGFALLRGNPEKLGRLSMTPEFQRLTMRAGVCLDGVGDVNAVVDAGVTRWLSDWKGAIADLI